MKNKCKVFFGTTTGIEKQMNAFFEENDIIVQHMTQTEHVGLNDCTYLTVTIIFLVEHIYVLHPAQ